MSNRIVKEYDRLLIGIYLVGILCYYLFTVKTDTQESVDKVYKKHIMAEGACPKKFIRRFNECFATLHIGQKQQLVLILKVVRVET
ncbi:MAG: hypothetical protein PHZ02_13460 [Desulfocapsaceae bacterium]|nr:hypothetical protein [Desulfocapsaceae bacterium]